jgi:hypothetical protein
MKPSQQLALWADESRDLSAMDLRFSENIYDQERYQSDLRIPVAFRVWRDRAPAFFDGQRLEGK